MAAELTDLLPENTPVEQLSTCARQSLKAAVSRARTRGRQNVESTDLLAGMVGQADSAVSNIIENAGISPSAVNQCIYFLEGPIDQGSSTDDFELSPRLARVVRRAYEDSKARGRSAVGTVDLLMAILDEGNGLALFSLECPGTGLKRIRDSISHFATCQERKSD